MPSYLVMVTLIKYWGQGKGCEINSISVVHFLEATAKIYKYHRFIIVNLSCVNSLTSLYRFNEEFLYGALQIKRTKACTLVQTEYKKGCTFSLLDCTAKALPFRLRSALAYMKFVLKRFQHQIDAKVKSALDEEDGTE